MNRPKRRRVPLPTVVVASTTHCSASSARASTVNMSGTDASLPAASPNSSICSSNNASRFLLGNVAARGCGAAGEHTRTRRDTCGWPSGKTLHGWTKTCSTGSLGPLSVRRREPVEGSRGACTDGASAATMGEGRTRSCSQHKKVSPSHPTHT